MDRLAFQTELKVAQPGTGPDGSFSGYAAYFGNVDSHGDVIERGAFAESLIERKAAGRGVPMHLMHRHLGGDGLPVGVWQRVEEDDKGLRVEGKLSGMNTDGERRLYELMRDGALGGLSVGFKVKPGGAVYATKANGSIRTLTKLDLKEISLVDDPSNTLTRIEVKSSAEFADFLRESGFSKAAARKLAHGGFAALGGTYPTDDGPEPAALDALAARLKAATLDIKSAGAGLPRYR